MSLFSLSIAVLNNSQNLIQSSKYFGGNGGSSAFDDKRWWQKTQIKGMRIACSNSKGPNTINGIQMKYGNIWAPGRGIVEECPKYDYATWTEYTFDSDERITSVNVTYGVSFSSPPVNFVHSLTMTTNKRMLKKCGTKQPTRNAKTIALCGNRLEYISGRQGCLIDGLQFHWSNVD